MLCCTVPKTSKGGRWVFGYSSKIHCKNCNSGYFGKIGQTCNIRLNEQRKAYRKGDLGSKLCNSFPQD